MDKDSDKDRELELARLGVPRAFVNNACLRNKEVAVRKWVEARPELGGHTPREVWHDPALLLSPEELAVNPAVGPLTQVTVRAKMIAVLALSYKKEESRYGVPGMEVYRSFPRVREVYEEPDFPSPLTSPRR